jgi:leucyl-tRNA synthetase
VVSNQLIDDKTVFPLELNTMPGWAGSSWYWMRYMDAHNENEFASQEALNYWENVDLYIGGSEHATGHLLYSRFWNKFLKDRGFITPEEPFKKLINQGMILGESAFVFVLQTKIGEENAFEQVLLDFETYKKFINGGSINILPEKLFIFLDERLSSFESFNDRLKGLERRFVCYKSAIDVNYVNLKNEINLTELSKDERYKLIYNASYFDGNEVIETNYITVIREVEKMSKSKYNVVNPDDICNQYGADTLRLYEMFLGPLEQAKPWNTAGITGVSGFLKKLWRLYFDDNGLIVTNDEPTAEMYKSLHKTIKKVTEDIENFSFNTSVSQFMICVNEMAQLKCNHRKILEPLAILVSPYAPHIAEELWSQLGYEGSISTVAFPIFEEKYLIESEKEYPVSFNGKMRFTIKLPLDLTAAQIEEIVMADERTQAQLQGRTPNKVIIVPGKIINLVG